MTDKKDRLRDQKHDEPDLFDDITNPGTRAVVKNVFETLLSKQKKNSRHTMWQWLAIPTLPPAAIVAVWGFLTQIGACSPEGGFPFAKAKVVEESFLEVNNKIETLSSDVETLKTDVKDLPRKVEEYRSRRRAR